MAQVEVHWNVAPWRVTAPYRAWRPPRTDRFPRVGLLESAILMGGKFLPRLNIPRKPIEHKYREGNVKRTLKRELKVFETVEVEAMKSVGCKTWFDFSLLVKLVSDVAQVCWASWAGK